MLTSEYKFYTLVTKRVRRHGPWCTPTLWREKRGRLQFPDETTSSWVDVEQGRDDKEHAWQVPSVPEVRPNIWAAAVLPWSWVQVKAMSSICVQPCSFDQQTEPFSSRLRPISLSISLRLRHVDTTWARCNGNDLHHQFTAISPRHINISPALGPAAWTINSEDCK